MVLDVDGDYPPGPIAYVEDERDIELPQTAEVRPVEAARRVRKTHLAHRAGRIGPPGSDGPVGDREVAREVAEDVERQGR